MRTDPAKVAQGAALPTTRPIWLLNISGFSGHVPALTLSSRESVVFHGQTYNAATLKVSQRQVAIYNELGKFTAQFMRSRGTVFFSIWKSYGEGPFVDADFYRHASGTIGTREFSDWITCELKSVKSRLEPHYLVSNSWCRHLIRKGTIFITPASGNNPLPTAPPPKPPAAPISGITIPPWLQLPVVPAQTAAKQNPVAITLQNYVAEGQPIPLLFGPFQIGAKPLVAHYNSSTDKWTVSFMVGLGEIESINNVWLNDAAPVSGVLVNTYTGDLDNAIVDPLLLAAIGGSYDDDNIIWATDTGVVGNPVTVAYIVVQWTNTHYSTPPSVVVEGFGLIGDIAAGVAAQFGYMEAPADFVRYFIKNMMRDRIDDFSVTAVERANNTFPTGTFARRAPGVIIDTLQPAEQHLEVLRMYAGCWCFHDGEQWKLVPDEAKESGGTLTADDFVQGTFNAFLQDGSLVPSVINVIYTRDPITETIWVEETSQWVADGVANGSAEWRESNVPMPGIQNYAEAAWEARERGLKLAAGLSFTGVVFDENCNIEQGDVREVIHPKLDAPHTFRITQADMIGTSSKPRMQISGVEYVAAAYDAQPVVAPTVNAVKHVIGEL